MKYVVFGDSIAKGSELKNKQIENQKTSFVKILGEKLNTEIENISVFGQTLSRSCEKQEFERFVKSLKTGEKATAIILLGGNDSDYRWKEVEQAPAMFHASKTEPEHFYMLLEKTIEYLKKHKIRVIIVSLPPVDSKRYFENVISKGCNSQKILEFFNGDIETISRHQEVYNIFAMKCAYSNNVEFVDCRTSFLRKRNYRDYICNDGIHPNDKGSEMIADCIFKKLQKK